MKHKPVLNRIRNLGIRPKIILFLLLVIIVPYALASVYSYYATTKAATNVESKSLEETTSLVEQDLVNGVSIKAQLYDLTFKHIIVDLETIKGGVIDNGFTDKLLNDYYYKHQFIKSVYFINAGGKVNYFPANTTVDTKDIPGFEDAAKSLAGKWTSPYADPQTKEQLVTYLLPVSKGATKLGVIGITIPTSKVFADIAPIDPSESSYVYIVRNNGEIISASDQVYSDLQIRNTQIITDSPVLKNIGKTQTLLDVNERQGVFALQKGKQSQQIVTFAAIPALGAKLFVTSPVGEIIQTQTEKAQSLQHAVKQVGINSLIYSVALAAMVVIIAYFLFGHELIAPLRRLQAGIKTLQSTNFDSRIAVQSQDEIGELAIAFNAMATGLQESNKHLVEEHDRLQASVNSLNVGFLMTDNKNSLLNINDAAKKLLGSIIGEEGKGDWDFDRVARSLKDGLQLEKVVSDSMQGHTQDMSVINFGDKIFHVFAGPIISRDAQGAVSTIGSVLLLEDITEAKVMERSRDEFFSIASHELRTPLTTIRGNSSMMLEIYADNFKDKGLRQMLTDIHQSSKQLIEIVNDFLDVSRIEQGKVMYTFEAVRIDNILEAVIYEMARTINEKGIDIITDTKTLEALPMVIGDQGRIKQIIYNLMGNAVKFTDQGSIAISTKTTDGRVWVSITDTGRGIPLDHQSLLFHKFQQANDSLLTRDTTRGTGLGLYISKLLVEGMGGELKLKTSEPGKGSTFTFSLLIADTEQLDKFKKAQNSLIDTTTGLTHKATKAP